MLAIELSPDMEEMMESVSRETGKSMKELVREALDRFLEEWEDRHDAIVAERVQVAYLKSPGSFATMDDVLEEAGLSRDDLR
ncbi:MAG: hypothetical protein HQL56_02935 [Magnetococcales bacterium]|nr:hypothetical protein [Magnetococcales bacterium]